MNNEMKPLNTQIGGKHYKDLAIQPIEYSHRNGLNFCEGNVVKYISRWRDKGGLADLKKVKHYVDLLIELEGLEPVVRTARYEEAFDPYSDWDRPPQDHTFPSKTAMAEKKFEEVVYPTQHDFLEGQEKFRRAKIQAQQRLAIHNRRRHDERNDLEAAYDR